MGWGSGTNAEGREVGYSVSAVCDKDGCAVKIDRGLAYVCGSMHDGGEHGCGRYFCDEHMIIALVPDEQLCEACLEEFEREYPDEVAAAAAEFEARVDAMRTAPASSTQEGDGHG